MNYAKAGSTFRNEVEDFISSELLPQLPFIREHHRYPVDTKRLKPILSSLNVTAVALLFYVVGRNKIAKDSIYPLWLFCMMIWLFIPLIMIPVLFRQLFLFAVVKTGKSASENNEELVAFFQAHEFVFDTHQAEPGLFSISSSKRDSKSQELILFVVDEGKILIHYKFINKTIGPPHHRKLAKALRNWMVDHQIQKEAFRQ